MSPVQIEIAALEERLRLAELGPDPDFFQEVLADEVVLVNEEGTPFSANAKVVELTSAARNQNLPGWTWAEWKSSITE